MDISEDTLWVVLAGQGRLKKAARAQPRSIDEATEQLTFALSGIRKVRIFYFKKLNAFFSKSIFKMFLAKFPLVVGCIEGFEAEFYEKRFIPQKFSS